MSEPVDMCAALEAYRVARNELADLQGALSACRAAFEKEEDRLLREVSAAWEALKKAQAEFERLLDRGASLVQGSR